MIPLLPIDAMTTGPTVFAALVLATFVSEDLTCLAAGLLVAAGRVDWLPALTACFAGIALGDAGVWFLGRTIGRRAAGLSWVRKRLPGERFAALSGWLEHRGGAAAFVSRCLPGTRVPLLLAAGIAPRGGTRYLFWTFGAALVWVPLVVGAVALFGHALPWWAAAGGAVGGLIAVRTAPRLQIGRAHV